MQVRVLSHTMNPTGICAAAAAICTNADDYLAALRGALASGHESVIEHASITFVIEGVSRVLLAQLTRHRLASFSVESQRYCGANLAMVIPDSMAREELVDDLVELRRMVQKVYDKAQELGVPEEDIRYFTLQGGETSLIMTMNLRELLHFLELRTCNRAQWEIRDLADAILLACMGVAPEIFKRAGCACMQGKPCPEGKKSCGHPRKREVPAL